MPLKQAPYVNLSGLWTDPNPFSKCPVGSFSQADNVVVDRDSIVEARRGYNIYGNDFGFQGTIDSLFSYQATLLAHGSNKKLYYDSTHDGLNWIPYNDTYVEPLVEGLSQGSSRIRSTQARKNFYFTTNKGVYKLDRVDGQPVPAGAPPALGGFGTVTGATGFLPISNSVAYRVLWGYRDANGYQITGAPSARIIVINGAASSANVNLSFYIPKNFGVGTNWFYQVYRSTNAPAGVVPDDNSMQLVIESSPTAAQVTAGIITVLDTLPEEQRQAQLYTSLDGIQTAHYPPPLCTDLVTYLGRTFYSATSQPHTLFLSLEGTGAPNGLQVGDTVTFTSISGPTFTLTGAAAENAALGQFQVFTAGTPSQNIENTAISLIKIFNLYPVNNFLAGYYVSDFQDWPGQMQFSRMDNTNLSFRINSNRTTAWSQVIPDTGSTFYNTSQNDSAINRIYYSEQDLPEAVPLVNYINVGDSNSPIVRLVLLQNSLFILKTDGVFKIQLSTPNSFNVIPVDRDTKIVCPNSVATLANKVYFYATLGIVAFYDAAVTLMEPIAKQVVVIASNKQIPFIDNSYGISYESDRKYIFASVNLDLAMEDGDNPVQMLVWNYTLQTWVRWLKPTKSAIVNDVDDKLYFGTTKVDTGNAVLLKERKLFADTDYIDEELDITIVSATDLEIELVDATYTKVNTVINQAGNFARVTSVDYITNIVTVDLLFTWTAGPALAITPIKMVITSVPQTNANPGLIKEQHELSLLFERTDFDEYEIGITTDINGTSTPYVVNPIAFGQWGQFAWGVAPWGGSLGAAGRIRTLLPTSTRRANWFQWTFTGERAFTSFSLLGYSIAGQEASSKQK